MGVYIKNMKMPDCCYECGLYQERKDTGYYDYAFCGASEEEFNDFYEKNVQRIDETEERLASCPLIEIKPHGDLIDRDVLWKVITQMDEAGEISVEDLAIAIQYTPVVIPAKSEEQA